MSLLFGPLALLAALSGLPGAGAPSALSGTVIDVNGHPLRGARVAAVHQESGTRHETEANDLGLFTLSDLAAGRYVLQVGGTGFRPLVTPPVTVELGKATQLALTLELDSVEEHVAVSYRAPLLQTDSAVVGQVITGSTASALPLSGRNLAQLALLLPGVVTTAPGSLAQPKIDVDGRPYVNGHREQGNSFMLDGVEANEPLRNTQSYDPSPEAVEEVRFETNNYSAEYGNLAGAMIHATLKAGTNRLRGSLFEFYRPAALAANDWASNRVGAPRPATRQHSFGATLSGPLWKDRVFFFADYEALVKDDPRTFATPVAPAEWRRGDFSKLTYSTGAPLRVLDPSNQYAQFPGNVIPESRFSPVARTLLARPELYPLPNVAGKNDFLDHWVDRTRQHQGDVKITAQPTARDTGALRFTVRSSREHRRSESMRLVDAEDESVPFRSAGLNWNRTFGVGGLNQLEVGYSRLFEQFELQSAPGLGDMNVTLGLEPSQERPGLSLLYFGLTPIGSTLSSEATARRAYFVSDQVSVLLGRHQVKAGGEWLRSRIESRRSGYGGVLGSYDFTGSFTNFAFADFLLGHVAMKMKAYFTDWEQQQDRVGLFVEDAFRPHSRLTATVGLRWSYFSPWVEAQDRQISFDLVTGEARRAGQDGHSRALYEPYYRGFEPRLGLAWTPFGRFVVRGGYGVVQSMEGIPTGNRLTQNPPFLVDLARTYGRTAPGGYGFDDVGVRYRDYSGRLNAYDPKLKPQWTQQWNLFAEQAFGDSLTLNVGYVGHRARRLLMPVDYNQPLPGSGPPETWPPAQRRRPFYSLWPNVTTLSVTTSRGRSRYDGLQAVIRQRPSRRLELMASYTWSKAATHNVHYVGSISSSRPRAGTYVMSSREPDRDFGPSFFDVRHNFVVSGTYELPRWLSGATVSGLVMMHTGFPITVVDVRDRSLQRNASSERPDRLASGAVDNPSAERWIDPSAFAQPALGHFGNSGVGILRGPGYASWNLSLMRAVQVAGPVRVVLKAQAFNLLNHPNLGLPARDLANPTTFGRIAGTIDLPRRIEVGMKVEF
jgi:hypothetical protein